MEQKKDMTLLRTLFLLFAVCITFLFAGVGSSSAHPVKDPTTEGYAELPYYSVRNKLTIPQIQSCIVNGGSGLVFDMTVSGCNITTLQDGTTIDPAKIYGTVFIGPYPFEESEVNYTYKRFRRNKSITDGKGTLDIPYLLQTGHNSEDWTEEGQVVVRLSLKLESTGKDVTIGDYDTIVRFKKAGSTYVKLPSITEGPMVNMITSDNTGEIVVSFKTSDAVQPKVVLTDGGMTKEFTGTSGMKHEITLLGLAPSTEYWYYVEFNDGYGDYKTKIYPFKSAPEAGKGSVKFAFTGDSREGVGGGDFNFMGLNFATLERLSNLAYQMDVDLLLEGGDLFNGYTSVPEDFRTQFYAWKQALSGLWSQKPVYAGMGNHESLLKAYTKSGFPSVQLDRWPYDTDSAEAVFADELVQPLNGPSDPLERPTYKENVYSFQYGPIKFISFNNTYWAVFGIDSSVFGGSPEGYVMEDQLAWIDQELKKAEEDHTVKYVVLFAHEPVVPNGGHIDDSMWYFGNNNVKAYIYNEGTDTVEAAGKGIVDVRNELVKMISNYKKVAAVLGAHEHSHSKVLINKDIPLGDPATDDANGNNTVCEDDEPCSALSDVKYPTWYLVSGDAGAPYYTEEETPWNAYWKSNPSACSKDATSSTCYYYSSQENIYIFEADSNRLSVTVYSPYGKVIDEIEDLMAIKK